MATHNEGGPGASATGSGNQGNGNAADQLRQSASEAAGRVTEDARNVGERLGGVAKEQVQSVFREGQTRAADEVGGVAQTLRTAAQQLEEHNAGAVARYAERAATEVENFAERMRQKDPAELMQQVARFAERQPGLFVMGAVATGFLLARFARASTHPNQRWRPSAQGGRGQSGYGQGSSGQGSSGQGGYTSGGRGQSGGDYSDRGYGYRARDLGARDGSSGGFGGYGGPSGGYAGSTGATGASGSTGSGSTGTGSMGMGGSAMDRNTSVLGSATGSTPGATAGSTGSSPGGTSGASTTMYGTGGGGSTGGTGLGGMGSSGGGLSGSALPGNQTRTQGAPGTDTQIPKVNSGNGATSAPSAGSTDSKTGGS